MFYGEVGLVSSQSLPSEMALSKSSISPSFISRLSDDGSVLEDVAHFEDIGLEEAKPNIDYNEISHDALSTRPCSSHELKLHPFPADLAGAKARDLAGPQRLLTKASSSSLSVPRMRRPPPLTLHSQPNLPSSSVPRAVLSARGRAPPQILSSSHLTIRSGSAVPSAGGRKSPVITGPWKRPRRSSCQSARERKTSVELEREYDEDIDDDVIPDDIVLNNVPLSPRPMVDRQAGPGMQANVTIGSVPHLNRAPSGDNNRGKEKPNDSATGSGTPPVPGKLNSGSLKSFSPAISNRSTLSDTTAPTTAHSLPETSIPSSPTIARSLSWNAALSELSVDARLLTAKLEEHADKNVKQRPGDLSFCGPSNCNVRRSSYEPTSSLTLGLARRGSSVPTFGFGNDSIPRNKLARNLLLQQIDVMIDPLPISKEKEAVLSRTRPSWLPPKNPAEEKRHLREFEKMMAHSYEMERKKENEQKRSTRSRDATADARIKVWECDVLPNWVTATREKRTRELWWAGVAPRSRGKVWMKAIGNDLGLNVTSFNAALKRGRELEQRIRKGAVTKDEAVRSKEFAAINADVSKTWPDLKIFQPGGPLSQALVDVLTAYAMYRSDIGYISTSGCNTVAALLLLNLPSPADSFVALANVLNRPLPVSFYSGDKGPIMSAYNLLMQALETKSPRLACHFRDVLQGQFDVCLFPMFSSIFTANLALDEVARLWDVYVFEGDSVLIRASVAIMLMREMDLLAATTPAEFYTILRCGEIGIRGNTNEEHWIKWLREAGSL